MGKSTNTMLNWNYLNILYVMAWAGISFVSSYNSVLELNLEIFSNGDFYKDLMTPLLIWIIAFFVDYLYTTYSIDKKNETLDVKIVAFTYVLICLIFVILLLSIHLHIYCRDIWVILLYCCMIILKGCTLYVVRPTEHIKPI